MANYRSVDIIMIIRESRNNYAAAVRLYAERYPNRRHPSNVTIQILTQRVRNGTLTRQRRHHQYDENDSRVITILAMIHLDSHISSCQIERERYGKGIRNRRDRYTPINSNTNIECEKV